MVRSSHFSPEVHVAPDTLHQYQVDIACVQNGEPMKHGVFRKEGDVHLYFHAGSILHEFSLSMFLWI